MRFNKYRIAIVLCLIGGIVVFQSKPRQAMAKSKYWLSAMSYETGGTSSVKYKGTKIKIKGKWGKGKSMDLALNAGKKSVNKTLKLASNCKVIEVEMPKNHVYPAKKYFKKIGLKKGKILPYIELNILIENKKVKKIYTSA